MYFPRMIVFVLAMAVSVTAMTAPFRLPPGVEVTESSDGKGWQANGTIPISFRSAGKRLASAVASAGWHHRHTIELGGNRTLDAWECGGRELTVMVWRIAPGKSGFSYGISEKSKATKDRSRPVRRQRRN